MTEAVEDVVEDKESMDDTILADLREITARVGADVPADEAPADEAPVSEERARDPVTGKFAKQDESATAPETGDAQTEEGSAGVAVADDLQGIDLNRPPSSWKPAAKAAWNNLPQEVREDVYRRENAIHSDLKGLRPNADFGQKIKEIAQPYEMLLRSENTTVERAFESLMNTAATFRLGTPQQKAQAAAGIIQQYGIDPQAVFGMLTGQPAIGQQGQQPGQIYDPRVDQLTQYLQAQEQARMQQDQTERDSAVDNFFSAKDDKGALKYPYAENVLDDMEVLIKQIKAGNPRMAHEQALEQAYHKAVWANPETRAQLLKEQQAQAEAKRSEDNLRRVAKARQASAGVIPKRGSAPLTAPAPKFGTAEADQAIAETYRQLTGT